jgi:phage terminase Nu1 subunit (DNA packaging protein)
VTLRELKEAIGVTTGQIRGWIAAGMPVLDRRPYRFDYDAVADWLIAQGKAHEEQPPATETIHRTRADIARALGVAVRTISDWATDPTFPGRMGEALSGDGHFPESVIREWARSRGRSDDEDSTSFNAERRRKTEIESQLLALKLQQRRGELVEIELVAGEIGRAVAMARQKLTPLAEIVFRMLPDSMDVRVKDELRAKVEAAVVEACEAVASAVGEVEE